MQTCINTHTWNHTWEHGARMCMTYSDTCTHGWILTFGAWTTVGSCIPLKRHRWGQDWEGGLLGPDSLIHRLYHLPDGSSWQWLAHFPTPPEVPLNMSSICVFLHFPPSPQPDSNLLFCIWIADRVKTNRGIDRASSLAHFLNTCNGQGLVSLKLGARNLIQGLYVGGKDSTIWATACHLPVLALAGG